VAKKIWHRGAEFTARDIFDLSVFLEFEPNRVEVIRPILEERRRIVLERIDSAHDVLSESFDALDILDYRKSFDECVNIVRGALLAAD
jgi:hypothetical protein